MGWDMNTSRVEEIEVFKDSRGQGRQFPEVRLLSLGL